MFICSGHHILSCLVSEVHVTQMNNLVAFFVR